MIRCYMLILLLAMPFNMLAQPKFEYEASMAAGYVYWNKTINETVTVYDPFKPAPDSYSQFVRYHEHNFSYNLQAKIWRHFNNFSFALSYKHARTAVNRLKSNPFHYSWLSYYKPEKKHFNAYGVCVQSKTFSMAGYDLSPSIETGFHRFEAHRAQYYKNNYYLTVGFKVVNSLTSSARFFVKPELTFMNYKFATVDSFFEDDQQSIEGAWQRVADVHKNKLLFFQLACGILLNHNKISEEN